MIGLAHEKNVGSSIASHDSVIEKRLTPDTETKTTVRWPVGKLETGSTSSNS